MATTKPTKFINAVDINGELYYVSDSYVEENYLPLSGNQTLTGTKTFLFDGDNTSNIELGTTSGSEAPLQINYDNSNYYALHLVDTITNSSYLIDVTSAENEGSEINLTLPNKSGTFALLEDLTDGYVTTDTDQYITGVKTFQNSILLNKYDPDLPHLGTNEGKLGFNDDSNLVELEIKYDPGYAGSGTSKTDLDARGLAVLFTGTRTIPAYSTSYNASSISYTPNALSDDPISYTYNFPTESGTLATQEYVDAHVGGEQIPEKLTLAYNLVTNQYQVTKQGIKFGSEQEYGGYIRRQLQTTSGQAITDEETIKEYLYFMTGVDALPTYDTSTNQTCFLFLTSNNTCWKLQYDGTGLWAYKVDNFPFATKAYVDEHSGATNIENGAGVNSIQQKESSKGFEFDNPNYTPTFTPAFGAVGKDSTVLNGNSEAYGELSTAEGRSTLAVGARSHAEGTKTVAMNSNTHAEGLQSVASGEHSHAEGHQTQTIGFASHSEGSKNISQSYASHTEGGNTKAGISDRNGIVEWLSTSSKTYTIEAGSDKTLAVKQASVSRGQIYTSVNNTNKTITVNISGTTVDANNKVLIRLVYTLNNVEPTPPGPTPDPSVDSGNGFNHAEGYLSQAFGACSHAEGHSTASIGQYSHAEGYKAIAFGTAAHAEGFNTEANGLCSHAGGMNTKANRDYSFAHGQNLTVNSDYQVVLGKNNTIDGSACFIIGNGSSATDTNNIFKVTTSGVYFNDSELATANAFSNYYTKSQSDAKYSTATNLLNGTADNKYNIKQFTTDANANTASGYYSVALGIKNTNDGYASVTAGMNNEMHGAYSFAFGMNNVITKYAAGGSSGTNVNASAVFGINNQSKYPYQLVCGKYNDNKSNTLFEVGNAPSNDTRSNAFEVYQDGHAEVKSGMKIVNGNLQIGNTTLTEAQLQKLLALLDAMEVR